MLYFRDSSRGLVKFTPNDLQKVTVWCCGPTVYAKPHIGNLRSLVVFDVLHRVLRRLYGEETVHFVRNYTDIDDKIMDAARERGVDISVVAAEAIMEYEADARSLHVIDPISKPRVTEFIPEILDFVKGLIEKGLAYESEGHVLFDRGTNPQFYLNENLDPESLKTDMSYSKTSYKRNPADFVLWKPSVAEQPGWDSPWGSGRPGWHIECSAMIRAIFGPTIDIHGGGVDLKFPHHECECAQSHGLNGAPLARHWLHNGMLNYVAKDKATNTLKTGKMSKSLGNIVTLDTLAAEGYSAEAIRYFLLTAHYTQPLVFDEEHERLNAARESMKTLQRAMRIVKSVPAGSYMEPLLDDLNTPRALARLHELANAIFAKRATKDEIEQFISLADVLGLRENYEVSLSNEARALQHRRDEARRVRDFATADQIREQLIEMGVEVSDSPLQA